VLHVAPKRWAQAPRSGACLAEALGKDSAQRACLAEALGEDSAEAGEPTTRLWRLVW
jgi:hypothetical protein